MSVVPSILFCEFGLVSAICASDLCARTALLEQHASQ